MKKTRFTPFVLAVLALAASQASATVTFFNSYSGTVSEVNSSTELAYDTQQSSTDLINGVAATGFTTSSGNTSGTWNTAAAQGATVPELNDGIHGLSFAGAGNTVQGAWPNSLATATYTIGLGANSLGYNITSIQSIAAWVNAGFGNQAWTLAVQPAGGGSFVDVATVNYTPFGTSAGGASKVTLTGMNITGVQAVRVTTISVNGGNNGGSFVWRELDVTGASTVPEPSSALLVGLGGLAVLLRRR